MKKIAKFGSYLRKLFRKLQINNNLQLNGSYASSLWASDIDLYERVKSNQKKTVQNLIKELSKSMTITEVKVVTDKGKQKITKQFDKVSIPLNCKYVKVDIIIIYELVFPIELTIIYDFVGHHQFTTKELINSLLEDVESTDKNLYKSLKRLSVIGNLLGYPKLFDKVVEDPSIGVIYQSINRLDVLNEIKDIVTKQELKRFKDIVQNDLGKFNLSINDNLISVLDKKIVGSLTKYL